MAVAFDAKSRNAASDTTLATGNMSWTHTPVGTPRGVIVKVIVDLNTDQVSAVTYGGVALTRVRFTPRNVTETSGVYLYFLGSGIPTGPQTVAVTVSGATNKQAYCETVTAAADTAVDANNGSDLGIIANPSLTVTHSGSLTGWYGTAAHYYGGAAPVSTGLQSGETYGNGVDFGAAAGMSYYRTGGAAASSSTYGYTTLVSDDQLIAAMVIKESGASAGAVTLTDADAVFTAVAVTPVPQPVQQTVTPAGLTFTAVAVTPTPQTVTLTLTPATAAITAVSVQPTPTSTASLAPAAATFTANAVTPTPQPVALTLQPATATLLALPVTVTPGVVTATLTPAAASFAAIAVTPAAVGAVTLTPATATLTAIAVAPAPGQATVTLTPATLTITARPFTNQGSASLTPAALTIAALPVSVTPQPVTITLVTAGLTLAAQPVSPTPQPVTVALATAVLTIAAATVTPTPGAATVTLEAAALTLAAVAVAVGAGHSRNIIFTGVIRQANINGQPYQRTIRGRLISRPTLGHIGPPTFTGHPG